MGMRAILFGKLPRHGDFVARGLDARAREAWDAWLSAGLERARGHLAEGFASAHDAAPPWRFVSGPGPLGEDWRAGALAPSVDAAGRRFVIMIAADGLEADEAAGFGETLAEAMEDLIYRAFEVGWDANELNDACGALIADFEVAVDADAEPAERWWTLGGQEHDPASLDRAPRDLIATLLNRTQSEAET